MASIGWSTISERARGARSVGVLLGSFDPPHLGHGWIAGQLLDRFEQVALLVPAWHFDKSVCYPSNATFEQRMLMLREMGRKAHGRISIGLAQEVLYVRLAQALRETFPLASVGFGMGDESWRRMLASRTYFERKGTRWTPQDEEMLSALRATSLVFARSGASEHGRACGLPTPPAAPEPLCRLSSTDVRARVHRLREQGLDCATWPEALSDCVTAEIAAHIARFGLY